MARIDGAQPRRRAPQSRRRPGRRRPAERNWLEAGQAAGARGSHDVLSLSPRVRVIAEAARAVSEARDVRAEKVAALKAAIANGTYTSNARDIAARLLANGIAGDLG
ncbi:flagellar biosynthesis anti-sigma factor FlgM [Tepidiforma flava]|uniref:Negative regulator of flagellin synthesis n=1 Tax=Tepidiforma flava TaxID=3004094 RepID=A0ABY7M2W8_9CHLR|nr:flagellar biosynthesis anti-sigma factor FlgM [Tepidiforma flava]WBL35002.1 flagellar biosynthesis anti-sigma factor FlgM [Tepidiforma flava]